MREEHDVRLVVVQSTEDGRQAGRTFAVERREIIRSLRKGLVRWLIAAVALGCIASGIAVERHSLRTGGDVVALIGFDHEGAEKGLDPAGEVLDVTKIASPSVVEEAVESLGLSVGPDRVRTAIDIRSVIPDEVYEQLTLYYDIFSRSSDVRTVQSLLETDRTATEYLVAFDSTEAGVSQQDGAALLDAVLAAYRRYFEETYYFHDGLGNAVSVIDYRDYDYAEAVDIFSSVLDQIRAYVSSVAQTDTQGFRSSRTGYSFSDLLRTVEILQDTELERAASYISVNSVTANDLADQTAYYRWRIQELQELRAVHQARLTALNESISSYEKDPVVYTVGEGGTVVQQSAEGDAYDEMIREKLDTQQAISTYGRTIAYYEDIVAGFQEAGPAREDDIEKVEGYLEALDRRVDALVAAVIATTDEYYSKAAFDDTVRILIPASAQGTGSSWGRIVFSAAVVEAALIFLYLAAAVVSGLYRANGIRRSRTAGEQGAPEETSGAEGI